MAFTIKQGTGFTHLNILFYPVYSLLQIRSAVCKNFHIWVLQKYFEETQKSVFWTIQMLKVDVLYYTQMLVHYILKRTGDVNWKINRLHLFYHFCLFWLDLRTRQVLMVMLMIV